MKIGSQLTAIVPTMFRASTDGGATFSNSTNLSNTTDADSWRVEIAGE